MITRNNVKEYVKQNLGFPFTPFELSDEQLEYWIDQTLLEFSTMFPYVRFIVINIQDPKVWTGKKHMYYIPSEHEILDIINVYGASKSAIIAGHPLIIGPLSNFAALADFFMNVDVSIAGNQYSYYNITYEFYRPNKLQIFSNFDGVLVVEAETMHDRDLSTLGLDLGIFFRDYYTAKIARVLSRIRKMYNTISTPFGDINVSTEELDSLADKIEEETKERAQQYRLGVIVDRG